MIDFGELRAVMWESQIPPQSIDTMSLYEINSMLEAAEARKDRRDKKAPHVSDDDWEQAQDMLASVVGNDPTVRLH